jgi:hypothetical protein
MNHNSSAMANFLKSYTIQLCGDHQNKQEGTFRETERKQITEG